MTLGFIATLIGVFVGLVVLGAAMLWLLSEYGEYVIRIIAILGLVVVLGYAAWEITKALVSKG